MKTVQLYGTLGERFGHIHRFDVRSPAEAVRALSANYPEFRKELLAEGSAFQVFVDTQPVCPDELAYPCAEVETIKIAPVVAGASGDDGGLLNIVLGAVLVAASFEGLPTAELGWAMMMGGVAQQLMDSPVSGVPNEEPGNQPSYLFDGPVNTTAQGNPVPLAYGEVFAGSQVISAGMSVEQLL